MSDDKVKEGIAKMVEAYEAHIDELKFALQLARQRENSLKEDLNNPRKDRRRRIFEQVALALLDQGDIDHGKDVVRHTMEEWAADTVKCAEIYAKAFIKAADEFAEKETEE